MGKGRLKAGNLFQTIFFIRLKLAACVSRTLCLQISCGLRLA
ncbi:hypothetical protein NEIMUCOT_04837 [Neisseria mucosa ATCC 25996]|uniref:Uncharacterized protein n=1 Tax=Neisseria mucosa (strain ATCC 25996 / DSM 4631 / NCTC 10774 / M26) TaxID=546266 RepID=D2ZW44_NEIM2|nr:hypothetical protein NEIMUCOT_04837 [Neisseria mucosa ATCC 25996]